MSMSKSQFLCSENNRKPTLLPSVSSVGDNDGKSSSESDIEILRARMASLKKNLKGIIIWLQNIDLLFITNLFSNEAEIP